MNHLFFTVLMVTFCSCGQMVTDKTVAATSQLPLSKDTCDDPDANINCCFKYMPKDVGAVMNIAGANEPGERMTISGTVFKADGKTPYPDLLLYAYHTDVRGYYPKDGNETGVQKWHGRLHGWCKTDAAGSYTIHTIRPARYPDNSMPAHIHMAVRRPENNQTFYITDCVFSDDSLVNANYMKTIRTMRGGLGIIDLKKSYASIWEGERTIKIGP